MRNDLESLGIDLSNKDVRRDVMEVLYDVIFTSARENLARVPRRGGRELARKRDPSRQEEKAEKRGFFSELPPRARINPLLSLQPSPSGKGVSVPVYMHFKVNKELFPALVSGATVRAIWVDERNAVGSQVRAGVCSGAGNLARMFNLMIQEVIEVGMEVEWGNVHPLSEQGVQNAVAYVEHYGIRSVDLLVHPDTTLFRRGFPAMYQGANVRQAPWLEEDMAVVVPKDRSYLGSVFGMDKKDAFAAVMHNPSRGMAVATTQVTYDESPELDTEGVEPVSDEPEGRGVRDGEGGERRIVVGPEGEDLDAV